VPSGVVISLEMDQESSGIALVYVCVCYSEYDVSRLGCGFVLLYCIFYILSSILCNY